MRYALTDDDNISGFSRPNVFFQFMPIFGGFCKVPSAEHFTFKKLKKFGKYVESHPLITTSIEFGQYNVHRPRSVF